MARRRFRLLLVLAVLAACTVAASPPSTAAPVAAAGPAVAASAFEADLLDRLNGARRARGLRPLVLATGLERAAASHARAMARGGFFSHTSPDGTSPGSRIRRSYDGSLVGETLLWRSPGVSAAEALKLWLGSPSHRAILLDGRFRDVGLAAVHVASAPGAFGGREVTIVVADFGVL